MKKKKLVVLTGAGISAESGIPTFRDSNGLWEGHEVMEVASPQGWAKNRELVLNFYNQRRRNLATVKPNRAHLILQELEKQFEVVIVTQNVDDLHERAGSKNIIHLHGELTKARSTQDEHLIYNIGYRDVNLGEKCEKGSQLRPHIVWFGEMVPEMDRAAQEAWSADVFLVVGTSLLVYPAAGLIDHTRSGTPKYIVDLQLPPIAPRPDLEMIEAKASQGMEMLKEKLLRFLDEETPGL